MAKKRKLQEEEPKHQPKSLKSSASASSDEESESEESDEVEELKQPSSQSSSEEEESSGEEEEEVEDDDEDHEEEQHDEQSKLGKVKKLLEPFSKDQLIAILKEAAQSDTSVTAEIISSAELDPVHRKIFVHGLGWDATNETLIAALKPFGAIEECNVVTDKTTGRSKGYGFVLFKTRAAARKALKEPQKKIGNRIAACQLASTGPVQNQPGSEMSARKLYVANVGPQIGAEKLRAFFAKYGEIEDGPLGFDKMTGKFRGFAIIVYKTLEGIKKALEEPVKIFDGFKLLCSVAVEGRSTKNNNNNNASAGPAPVAAGVNAAIMPALALGFNPGAVLLGQNPASMGVLNPVLGGAFTGGITQSLNSPMGLNPGFGVQQGVTALNPSMIGGYGSQATFQGLGAYQNSQVGQPSAPATATAVARPQTGTAPFVSR